MLPFASDWNSDWSWGSIWVRDRLVSPLQEMGTRTFFSILGSTLDRCGPELASIAELLPRLTPDAASLAESLCQGFTYLHQLAEHPLPPRNLSCAAAAFDASDALTAAAIEEVRTPADRSPLTFPPQTIAGEAALLSEPSIVHDRASSEPSPCHEPSPCPAGLPEDVHGCTATWAMCDPGLPLSAADIPPPGLRAVDAASGAQVGVPGLDIWGLPSAYL
eukprot:gnl/TRDRNA2_/TRDRNA2_154490_c0_seq1.p1 gnl/TRDRNA2_/TRDRNA2_154490_c0~~gnl/TRDRNA2_/TRDRNA2_154490_c0_seq1.p1  ORF type:complete len:219 (-),score=27.59 gnl/TRDRNA2_/TRDRNA2_154490_c0_seq1:533-1189(-)